MAHELIFYKTPEGEQRIEVVSTLEHTTPHRAMPDRCHRRGSGETVLKFFPRFNIFPQEKTCILEKFN